MSFELNDEMAQAITEQYFRSSLHAILREVRSGEISQAVCEECGAEIPEARRQAVRGVKLCTGCKEVREHHKLTGSGRRHGR